MRDLDFLLGRTLDSKYRLDEKRGQGGMGAVFRATHLGTDRVVALKLIAPGLMELEEFVARFQREARATGRLRHPNIVDLTDFGFATVDGHAHAYLVMEYLTGCTLAEVMAEQKDLPVAWVVAILGQICSGLQHAHDRGIVHRDLKPENLWLEPDQRGDFVVKILDFGLAKLYDPKARAEGRPGLPMDDGATQALPRVPELTVALASTAPSSVPTAGEAHGTEVGTLLGTPAYMSPEQCRGIPVDARSDLYSLGVIAYQMLAGRPPFLGNSLDMINCHIQKSAPPLAGLRADLHPGIAAVIMAALSKDPGDRPASAEVLAGALEAYLIGDLGRWKRAAEFYLGSFGELARASFKAALPAVGILALLLVLTLMPSTVASARTVFAGGWCLGILWLGFLVYDRNRIGAWITLRALTWQVEPLGPPPPMQESGLEAWGRIRRRLFLRNFVPVALALAGLGLFIATAEDEVGASPPLTWVGLALAVAGILGAFRLARMSGSVAGREYFVPCILQIENQPYETARARSRALSSDPRSRLDRRGLTLLRAILALLAVDLTLVPLGAVVGLLPASHWQAFGLAVFLVLVTALAILAAPFQMAHRALQYLDCRRMCQEPLTGDFERFRARALGATQWVKRFQESIHTRC